MLPGSSDNKTVQYMMNSINYLQDNPKHSKANLAHQQNQFLSRMQNLPQKALPHNQLLKVMWLMDASPLHHGNLL